MNDSGQHDKRQSGVPASGSRWRGLIQQRAISRRGWLVTARIGVAMLLICLPAKLRAQSLIELQLEAPSGCPGRMAILSAVGRLVQKTPQSQLNARARFAPEGGHWVLDIAFDQGQRRVAGDTCLAVAEALVVILALAVDPSARLNVATFPELEHPQDEPPKNASAPSPETLQPAALGANRPAVAIYPGLSQSGAPPPSNSDGSVPNQQKDRARFGLSLLMLTETGALPSWALGPSLFAHYGRREYWGEFSINRLEPRWAASTQSTTKGGQISWFAGQVAGCWMPEVATPIGGCLGAELGDLIGKGDGVDHSQTAFALWLAATASAVLRAELRPALALEARIGLAVPALRPEFGLVGYGGFFRPDWVSLRASLGFSWR